MIIKLLELLLQRRSMVPRHEVALVLVEGTSISVANYIIRMSEDFSPKAFVKLFE